MKNIVFVCGLLAALLSLQVEAAAGRFQFVSGEVKVTSAAGKERIAHKGDAVDQGDTITSSAASSAQVKMADDGLVIVRPDTKLRITTFEYNGKADGSERSLISLVQGGFRAITGMIGRINKEHYKIETPTATIGIRGTDHEPMFIPNPVAGKVAVATPGTYDKVNSGAAVLSTARGMVVINPNHAGFVPNVANAAPTVLANIPTFYRAPTKDEPQIVPGASLQPNGAPSAQQPAQANASGGTTGGATLTNQAVGTSSGTPTSTSAGAALSTTTLTTKTGVITSIAPTTTTLTTTNTGVSTSIAPTLSTTTLTKTGVITSVAPMTLTTAIQPIATTAIAPISTTTVQPITTIAPTTLTTAIQPMATTAIAPISTTTVQPIMTIAPTTLTTTIQPLTTFSDRRLKKNIKRVGTHRLGFGIYEFDYVWGGHAIGVMADEVKKVMPEAVSRDASGYDMVDYSKIY